MEEAGALAKHMRQEIQSQNEALLRRVDTRETAKEAWTRVRQLIKTRDKADSRAPSGLTAHVLNRHYATMSTDSRYEMPPVKQTASFPCCFVTEMDMFRILDRLKPTATGSMGSQHGF